MDVGILILRVALALILIAHAGQKTLGWFQGLGLARMAAIFEDLGLRPGRVMVVTAATTEVAAAVSIATGLLTPLGAAAAAGAMAVAGLTMQLGAGRFWNSAGGGEYPYMLAIVAVVLGFAGPGSYSLDRVIADVLPGYTDLGSGVPVGLGVACLALLGAIPFAATIRRHRRR